eukprot:scaffold20935_cov69-Phaeocystis_antarctica.AAC.7
MASRSTRLRGATKKVVCFGQEQKRQKYSLRHDGRRCGPTARRRLAGLRPSPLSGHYQAVRRRAASTKPKP